MELVNMEGNTVYVLVCFTRKVSNSLHGPALHVWWDVSPPPWLGFYWLKKCRHQGDSHLIGIISRRPEAEQSSTVSPVHSPSWELEKLGVADVSYGRVAFCCYEQSVKAILRISCPILRHSWLIYVYLKYSNQFTAIANALQALCKSCWLMLRAHWILVGRGCPSASEYLISYHSASFSNFSRRLQNHRQACLNRMLGPTSRVVDLQVWSRGLKVCTSNKLSLWCEAVVQESQF